MNRYGVLAQEHWRRHAPRKYAELKNPTEFFETLGETAAAQIVTVSDGLKRQLPPDLPYLETVRELRAIQKQAEDLVLSDLVYSVEPEPRSLIEELEDLLGALPGPSTIEDQLTRLRDEAAEEADREGWAQPLLSEEQAEQERRWTALLPLVQLPREASEMTEAELSERIQALRALLPPQGSSAEL
ncbi:hypothetical protein GCM10028801_44540 [Nocardioides maradonensis]